MSQMRYEPIENMSLQKSNALVSAKYRSTLIENQIMAIALTRIEAKAGTDGEALSATLYPGELKRLLGDPQNIYRSLKKVSHMMTGHTIFMEDGKGNFRAHAIITDAVYQNGVFTINFNDNLRPHVLGLEKNFTSYELSVLTGFKKNSSFRIYELLKSHIYKSRKSKNDGRVDVVYNISELRFMIGLANGDDAGVKNAAAAMAPHIDWDILYDKLDKKDRKYEMWGDFQRYVIKPAQQELLEKSNIRFEYEGRRQGRKMKEILFHIYPNKPQNEDIIDEKSKYLESNSIYRQLELPRDQFPEFYEKYEGHNELAKEDLDLLIFTAGQDIRRVEAAIEAADAQNHLHNYMGWLISYLKSPREYAKTEVLQGDSKRADTVRKVREDYEQNKDTVTDRVWQKTKKKEEFSDFIEGITAQGITLEQFEELFDSSEKLDVFINWKKTGEIDI